MNYKINPTVYSSMCPIPLSIIDENIKLASPSQLKTILYFFRSSMTGTIPSVEQIASATGYDPEDCEDALVFWSERGILLNDNEEVKPILTQKTEDKIEEKQPIPDKTIEIIPVVKPTPEQISQRLSESDELKLLFRETDSILGKTMGYPGQATLLMIHDSYGMPIEVILTLIHYSKTIGRCGMTQISNLAKYWFEKDILTVELAEEYIMTQSHVNETWEKFRLATGIKNEYPTTKQREYFSKWTDVYKMSVDMIFEAYERSLDNIQKFNLPYMDKVLKNWNAANLFDVQSMKEYESNHKSKKSQPNDKPESAPSYDIGKFQTLGLKVD